MSALLRSIINLSCQIVIPWLQILTETKHKKPIALDGDTTPCVESALFFIHIVGTIYGLAALSVSVPAKDSQTKVLDTFRHLL